jgi:hypothetical protein
MEAVTCGECSFKVTVSKMKRGKRRRDDIVLMVNLKGTTRRFGSTSPRCGRAAHGGTWCSGAPGEAAAARASEGGRRPPGGPTWARGRRGLAGKGILTRKIKLGCQGFRAELILGYAEK